jgi:hypothetical protein
MKTLKNNIVWLRDVDNYQKHHENCVMIMIDLYYHLNYLYNLLINQIATMIFISNLGLNV